MLQWFYTTIYDAVAQFFTMMGNMGAEIFDLDWVKATVELFTLFGWALFVAGVVVAVFDVAIEYQHGRADIKSAAINVLKGFFGKAAFSDPLAGAKRRQGGKKCSNENPRC
nr:conjugal transfer protein TrbL family protein [Mediterraneibacter glycyrrhizinilyticus]